MRQEGADDTSHESGEHKASDKLAALAWSRHRPISVQCWHRQGADGNKGAPGTVERKQTNLEIKKQERGRTSARGGGR